MGIRVSDIKLPLQYSEAMLRSGCAGLLGIRGSEILHAKLVRRSLDARKKPRLFYVCTADVLLKGGEKAEERLLSLARKKRGALHITKTPKPYQLPLAGSGLPEAIGSKKLCRPVIIGCGPAGMACAYFLAKAGLCPIVIERGKEVSRRQADVEEFWKTGRLLEDSNVQFGEGGAGTFSDGKLNTLIKDKDGRCRRILELYVSMGAPESILYDSKPHVGTDRLSKMCENLRHEIIRLGGEVRFETVMKELVITEGKISGIRIEESPKTGPKVSEFLAARVVVLAVGHSARDTFESLQRQGVFMQAKPFAVGFRVIHPQAWINENQYGRQPEEIYELLGAAPYKLTTQSADGRGVYSFCMCPGGYVVNASSGKGYLAVNGMSYSGRKGKYANSAIILTVTPEDFEGFGKGPLNGMYFQMEMEKRAFCLAKGAVPVQRLGDFRGDTEKEKSTLRIDPGEAVKGRWEYADLREILNPKLNEAFAEGMSQFDKKIPRFADANVLMCGVESRSSSPVRIPRGENGQAAVKGLYPVGEGAGYAGGITSAAMDGLLAAERIILDFNERLKSVRPQRNTKDGKKTEEQK